MWFYLIFFFFNPCFVSKNNYSELHKSKKSNKENIARPRKAVLQLKRERRKMRFISMAERPSPSKVQAIPLPAYIPYNAMWNGTQNRSFSIPPKYANLLATQPHSFRHNPWNQVQTLTLHPIWLLPLLWSMVALKIFLWWLLKN